MVSGPTDRHHRTNPAVRVAVVLVIAGTALVFFVGHCTSLNTRERECHSAELGESLTTIFPRAPMATSGRRSTGTAYVPPIYERKDELHGQRGGAEQSTAPMFERENVPPLSSLGESFPSLPNCCSRRSSAAICITDKCCTFLMFGTNKPSLVSIATPMLCEPWTTDVDDEGRETLALPSR